MTDTGQASAASSYDYDKVRVQAARELNILRVADIKPILSRLGLPKTGNKPELIARLLALLDLKQNTGNTTERDNLVKLISEEVHILRGHGKSSSSSADSEAWPPRMTGIVGGKLAVEMGAGSGSASSVAGPVTNWRCLCGSTSAYGAQRACVSCHKFFHVSCLGNVYPYTRRDLCFVCIATRQDPFHEVVETLGGPLRTTAFRNEMSISFKLSQASQLGIIRSAEAGSSKRSQRVLVRCFPLHLLDTNKKPGAKAPKYPMHCWPLETHCRVNNTEIPIKQRSVYYHGMQRKCKGVSDPVDIFVYLRVGANRLHLTFKEEKQYVVLVQIVKKLSVEHLFKRVKESTNNPTYDQGLLRVQTLFGGKKSASAGDDDDDDDDMLMATVSRISLRCPLGMVPIVTPARGKNCNHLQCFDLSTYLQFNERNSATSWKCGVCNNPLALEDLEVDQFMLSIIEKLKASKSEDGEEVDTVEIDGDGQWKPHKEISAGAARKRKAEEAAASSSGKAAELVEIQDLSDDDDGDDDDHQPLSKVVRTNHSTAASSSSGASDRVYQTVAYNGGRPLPSSSSTAPGLDYLRLLALSRPTAVRYGNPSSSSSAPAPRPPSSASSTGGAPAVIDLSLDSDDEDDGGSRSGQATSNSHSGGPGAASTSRPGLRAEADDNDDEEEEDDEDDDEGPIRRRRAPSAPSAPITFRLPPGLRPAQGGGAPSFSMASSQASSGPGSSSATSTQSPGPSTAVSPTAATSAPPPVMAQAVLVPPPSSAAPAGPPLRFMTLPVVTAPFGTAAAPGMTAPGMPAVGGFQPFGTGMAGGQAPRPWGLPASSTIVQPAPHLVPSTCVNTVGTPGVYQRPTSPAIPPATTTTTGGAPTFGQHPPAGP